MARTTKDAPEGARQPPVGTAETNWAATLLLAALLLTSRQLPWALLAAVPAVVALVLAVRAVVLRGRAGLRGAAVWSGVGVLFAGYLLAGVAVQAVLYHPVDAYRRCLSGANTDIAAEECEVALREQLDDVWVSFLG